MYRRSFVGHLALTVALLHFSAGQPDNHPGGPAPTP